MNERADLCFVAGETASYVFQIKNIDGKPFDLTGAAVRSDIKLGQEYKDAFIEVPVVITDATEGRILWLLNSQQTAKMKNCGYCYDVKVYKNSVVHSALHGNITVDLGVTR